MKKFILGIIVGGIIFGTSVFAISNYLYRSDEVSYIPDDNSWNVSDVKEALNDLHNKAKNYIPKPTGNKQITISSTGTSSPVDVSNYETATCKTSGLYTSCSSCCSTSNTPTRTLLWSNPNPTSKYTGGNYVTSNYDIRNYNAIMIKYYPHLNWGTTSDKISYELCMSPSQLQEPSTGKDYVICTIGFRGSSYKQARRIYLGKDYTDGKHIYISDNQAFGTDYAVGADGNVPIAIYGVNGISNIKD